MKAKRCKTHAGIFPSGLAAARFHGISRQLVSYRCLTGYTRDGIKWEYIDG